MPESQHQQQSQILVTEERTGERRPVFPVTPVRLGSSGAGWTGVEVEQVVLKLETPEHHHEGHFLTLQLGSPARVEWKEAGGGRGGRFLQARFLPGEFSLIGAGVPHEVRYDSAEVLAVSLEPWLVQQAAAGAAVEFVPQHGRSDRQVERLCQLLKTELEMGGPSGPLFGDAIGQALSAHLLAHYAVLPPTHTARRLRAEMEQPPPGLDPGRLRRAEEFLQDNLGREVGLEEVAAAVGLSPHHFARQFKAATGRAPHAFLIERRVARAQELLARTQLPIAQIASAVGFAHQSHLTTHFRRLVGITPARYRGVHSAPDIAILG